MPSTSVPQPGAPRTIPSRPAATKQAAARTTAAPTVRPTAAQGPARTSVAQVASNGTNTARAPVARTNSGITPAPVARTNSGTTTAPAPLPHARELFIAQLAVQRAAIATKHVLRTINFSSDASSSASQSQQAPISRFLHPNGAGAAPTSQHLKPPTQQHQKPPAQAQHPQAQPQPQSQPQLSLAKSDTSPVTIADFAAQALLIAAIHGAFPNDAIVGEEDADALRRDPALAREVWNIVQATKLEDAAAEKMLARPRDVDEMLDLIALGGGGAAKLDMSKGPRFWCMDPVDGTSAFMKGGQYAISLSLLEGGREVMGVLGCPNLEPKNKGCVQERVIDREGMGLMLAAVRGQGATWRPMGRKGLLGATKIQRGGGRGAAAVNMKDIHFVDSSKSPATLTEKVRELAVKVQAQYPAQTELYSSHMRYAAMALGTREFVQLRWPKPGKKPWSIWDHAGSQLIYTESGAGVVTDLVGQPINFTTGDKLSKSWGVITADAAIHGKILELAAGMGAAAARASG